jgi:hypothetical protein
MTKTPQNIFLKIWSILTLIYIISISFQTILTLPVVDRKIQPPEIIFLMTIIFLLFNLRKISFSKFRWNKLDIGLVIYLGVILITTFFAKNIRPYIELLGLFYLFSSYLMIRLFLISINEDFEKTIKNGIIWMGIIASIFGIIGIATTYFFNTSILGYIYQDYPYFGDTIRVSGFTATPHMLASILNVSILVLLISIFEKRNFQSFFILLILSLAYIFTFAKIVILLII